VIRLSGFELDIDERRQTEEVRTRQLSQLAWDLTQAEHRAREQIAKTLHDGLQQLLVIVALNLDVQLKRDTESGRAPNPLLADAKRHLDEAIAAARSLNRVLIPPVLHRSGLPAALTWLADWTRDKYKLDVDIVADPLADSARSDLRTLIYESARELLFNAVKHAQTDRISLELALDADDYLCITVADQGVGFDPASLDDRWKTGQVGWGLFSIRERMTLLGGRFDLDSAPGRGTRVRLVAPRGAAEAGDDAPAIVPRLAVANAPDDARRSHALRILLVDDHAAVRNAMRQMLDERHQLSVVGEASDGIDAIVQARQLRPDVILMDIMMPHMDGIEATKRIHAELPDIQILGLSMQARSDTVHAIEHAGAAGFFVKGLDTQRLLDRLLSLHDTRAATVS
jgi:CheY-like chemotaxis protein/anti-sigma regulatory factor (Ser/Thr protein kinase)